jgi:hypothetical protein
MGGNSPNLVTRLVNQKTNNTFSRNRHISRKTLFWWQKNTFDSLFRLI